MGDGGGVHYRDNMDQYSYCIVYIFLTITIEISFFISNHIHLKIIFFLVKVYDDHHRKVIVLIANLNCEKLCHLKEHNFSTDNTVLYGRVE